MIAVVGDDNVRAAELDDARPDLFQSWGVGDVSIGVAVRPRRAGGDRVAGPNEKAKLVARDAVTHPDGSDLDDVGGRDLLVGRLEVDRGEVPELVPEGAHLIQLRGLEEGEGKAEHRGVVN